MNSRGRKEQKDEAASVKVELSQLTQPRGDCILHEKSITLDMAYRQSLMKYAEKYGISWTSRNRNRSYICFWRVCWDGSAEFPGLPVPAGLILESIKKRSKAFYSAESALDSYKTCFAPFRRKTEIQNAVLFQIKLIVLFEMSITAIRTSTQKRN